jgi:hypothetical protein
MEKEIEIFQPKSLQELCIKPLYADTPQEHKKEKKTNNKRVDKAFSPENINALNKKLPLNLYPSIAYHVLKTKKIAMHSKYAIICFLRDHPDKLDEKSKKILQFFARFIDGRNYYCSQLLPVALKNTVEPYIFNYLLQSGEKPGNLIVWHLIGDEQHHPNIHNYMIEKLTFLLKNRHLSQNHITNKYKPLSRFTPPEYANNMLKHWRDKKGTSSFEEEEIKKYKDFYTQVVALFNMYSQKAE